MKRVYDSKINNCNLVIAKSGETFTGIIRQGNLEKFRQSHENYEVLKAALINEAGKLHPEYIGIDGAIKRFRQFFPLGFDDPYYLVKERKYKDKKKKELALFQYRNPNEFCLETRGKSAEECLIEIKELRSQFNEKAALANDSFMIASKVSINLLSMYENARLHEILSSRPDEEGSDYLQACRELILIFDPKNNSISLHRALKKIAAAIKPFGSVTWPLVTILPYFWRSDRHMFLKPVATKDYADRVGHEFSSVYSSEISAETYLSLLDLANWTHSKISSLNPKDRIDVQSFIWVVGNYKDEDLKDAEKFRAQNS